MQSGESLDERRRLFKYSRNTELVTYGNRYLVENAGQVPVISTGVREEFQGGHLAGTRRLVPCSRARMIQYHTLGRSRPDFTFFHPTTAQHYAAQHA